MYLKVIKGADLKVITRKTTCNYLQGGVLTTCICGDHFTMYTNIKSLCCTPETNIVLYVIPQVKKKKNDVGKKKRCPVCYRQDLLIQSLHEYS